MVYSAKKNLPESHLVKIVGLWMKKVSADLSQEDLQAELEIEVDKFTSLGESGQTYIMKWAHRST